MAGTSNPCLTAEQAVTTGQPVVIYNVTMREYMFVSNDKEDGDHVVESHPHEEERNKFVLIGTSDNFMIYHPQTNRYLFVSNDKYSGNNVLEAHGTNAESRNHFRPIPIGDSKLRQYHLYNFDYNKVLFLSGDTKDSDHVIEARGAVNDSNEMWQFMLPKPGTIVAFRMLRDKEKKLKDVEALIVEETEVDNIDGTHDQSNVVKFDKHYEETTMVESTDGFELSTTIGSSASIGVEGVASVSVNASVTATISFSRTVGHSSTMGTTISGEFPVVAAPHTKVTGRAVMTRHESEVPYECTVQSNEGKLFVATGVCRGVHYVNLKSKFIENSFDVSGQFAYQRVDRLNLTASTIEFAVKIGNDANIVLASEQNKGIEIVIGGCGNTETVIRPRKVPTNYAQADTPNIVDANSFRRFWLSWTDGVIRFGRGLLDEGNIVLQYINPNPYVVKFIEVSGYNVPGTFVF